MVTVIFLILIFSMVGAVLKFVLKATWGIARCVFGLVVLPVVMMVLILAGLAAFVIPLLVMVALACLLKMAAKAV